MKVVKREKTMERHHLSLSVTAQLIEENKNKHKQPEKKTRMQRTE